MEREIRERKVRKGAEKCKKELLLAHAKKIASEAHSPPERRLSGPGSPRFAPDFLFLIFIPMRLRNQNWDKYHFSGTQSWLGAAASDPIVAPEFMPRVGFDEHRPARQLILAQVGGILEFAPAPRGTNSTCESDGGDSDGQGTLWRAGGAEHPPLRPAQRKFFRCLGVKRPVS